MSDTSMGWAFSTRVLVFTWTVDSPSLAHLALCENLSHAPGGYTFSLQSGEKKWCLKIQVILFHAFERIYQNNTKTFDREAWMEISTSFGNLRSQVRLISGIGSISSDPASLCQQIKIITSHIKCLMKMIKINKRWAL